MTLMSVAYIESFAYALRDGLGPDLIESSGLSAFRRFVVLGWLPLLVLLLVPATCTLLSRSPHGLPNKA